MRLITYICFTSLALFLYGCMPDMPVTSEIIIDGAVPTTPVNRMLYGITLEEANHAIDGGLYAELILNRSFEEGQLPPNCRYDHARNRLITPNGWSMPFVRPDSIPGWRKTGHVYISLETREPINETNKQYLQVYNREEGGRGGVIATGYNGIRLIKGEKYDLKFYLKGASANAKTLYICLEDSLRSKQYSEAFTTSLTYGWKYVKHTFTATDSIANAVLSFTTDNEAAFSLDDVSLFAQSSVRNNNLRADLLEHIQALQPGFLRFPGGIFAEGYAQGSYPIWHETIGVPRHRKNFFNVNGYTTTNGLGYHEYLVLCEQLQAEPIYVINAGITNQKRRPRYEDITKMKFLIEDALDAIAYANQPADSTFGKMRARNGHPAPFNLKYIEIGSENKGSEYQRRFLLFYEAIKEKYPEITIISNEILDRRGMNYNIDQHFYADPTFFVTNSSRFHPDRYSRKNPLSFITEFGTVDKEKGGTIEAALAEATFLTGVENSPPNIAGIAYSPLLSNRDFHDEQALIQFDRQQVVLSPSYYAFRLFAENKGQEVYKTTTKTYLKPFIEEGGINVWASDSHFSVSNIKRDHTVIADVSSPSAGETVVLEELSPTNFTFTASMKREKGDGKILFRFRDNKQTFGDRFVGVEFANNNCALFMQHGEIKDILAVDDSFILTNEKNYQLNISFDHDSIACLVNNQPILQTKLSPIPSLATTAAVDTTNQVLILKVINNTLHEEITHIQVKDIHIDNNFTYWQLKAKPTDRNTRKHPDWIVPEEKKFAFSIQRPNVFIFPPQSITVLRIPIKK